MKNATSHEIQNWCNRGKIAGNDTVTIPHLVIEILWVVLAHCAHSQERISQMSTSMEAWKISSTRGCYFCPSTSMISTYIWKVQLRRNVGDATVRCPQSKDHSKEIHCFGIKIREL